MKSSKKLQISSHLLFVYIYNQDRKWRMSVLVFSSALPSLVLTVCLMITLSLLVFTKFVFLSPMYLDNVTEQFAWMSRGLAWGQPCLECLSNCRGWMGI